MLSLFVFLGNISRGLHGTTICFPCHCVRNPCTGFLKWHQPLRSQWIWQGSTKGSWTSLMLALMGTDELMPRVVNICGSSISIPSKIRYMHIFWGGIMTDYVLWCLSSRDGSHHNQFLKGVHVRVYVMYVYIYICTDWWFHIFFSSIMYGIILPID
jgi:hypothetical protein